MLTPQLTGGVNFIIDRLNSHGKRADIVGGSVRDFLLGKEADDFDITTNATPEELVDIFSDVRTVETGIKHGTLTVVYEGVPYEVTTYRKDGEYTDHRHPDAVVFTDALEEDLSRRDFTVNAICYNEKDGFTDLFSGMEDIKHRIIRAVGDPYKRFDEDALRILRAIRFSATLGFEIEQNTAQAAKKLYHLLDGVSGERIYTEWKKLVGGECAFEVIESFPEIVSAILFPGLTPVLPQKKVFCAADSETRQLLLFALADGDPAELARAAGERMRFDNKTKKMFSTVLTAIDTPLNTLVDVNLSFMKIGEEATLELIRLRIALGTLDETALDFAEAIINESLPYNLSHLNVSGEDVLALGIVGKEVGEALLAALEAVIFENIRNVKFELLNFIKSYTGRE